MYKCVTILFDHVRALAQTISLLFSLWFTIVLTLKLMLVSGGVSFGAVGADSGIGFMSFGSSTVASNLHQVLCDQSETYYRQVEVIRTALCST